MWILISALLFLGGLLFIFKGILGLSSSTHFFISIKEIERIKNYVSTFRSESSENKKMLTEALTVAEQMKLKVQDAEKELEEKENKIEALTKQLETRASDHNDSQKNEAQLKKLSSELAFVKDENKRLMAEASESVEKIKTDMQGAEQKLKEKDHEVESLMNKIEALTKQLETRASDHNDSQKNEAQLKKLSSEFALVKDENKRLMAEASESVEKIKTDMQGVEQKLKAKELEIESLTKLLEAHTAEQKSFEEKNAQLKKLSSDFLWLEKTVDEQKKQSHQVQQRMEELKMKTQLISEKVKESVELIAHFAQGKEFDAFRKSIHLDEIIEKYEKEIKDLRIKNMELSKRFEARDGLS